MQNYTYPLPPASTLPVGAATEAKQDTTNTNLDTLIAKDFATSAKQDTTNTKLDTLIAKDFATSAKQDTTNTKLDTLIAKDFSTSTKQDTTNTKLDSIISNTAALARLTVVDMLDTPFLDCAGTQIPASAINSLQVVASTAAIIKKVQSVEDIGEFIGLYSGPVGTPTLLCVLPLGGGEVEVNIPAGTLLSLRNMKNAAISAGNMAINFLG